MLGQRLKAKSKHIYWLNVAPGSVVIKSLV